jgi:hypothetical protein
MNSLCHIKTLNQNRVIGTFRFSICYAPLEPVEIHWHEGGFLYRYDPSPARRPNFYVKTPPLGFESVITRCRFSTTRYVDVLLCDRFTLHALHLVRCEHCARCRLPPLAAVALPPSRRSNCVAVGHPPTLPASLPLQPPQAR